MVSLMPPNGGRPSLASVTVDPNAADGIRGGSTGDGAVNPPVDNNDLSFEVFVGYDSDNLYIAVRVKDDASKWTARKQIQRMAHLGG